MELVDELYVEANRGTPQYIPLYLPSFDQIDMGDQGCGPLES